MLKTADRNGNVTVCDSFQDKLLAWLYGHAAGRMLLKPLVAPCVSKIGGKLLDSRLSALAVRPFIRAAKMDMSQYEKQNYTSYNAFFKRKIAPGMRKTAADVSCFISPCDSRLSVYPVSSECEVTVKHTRYTLKELLKSERLAERYAGGYVWVFRLCVDDYHHYIYVDDGIKSRNVRIPGVFHTVNPVANDRYPIYKENTREYSLLRSEHFGTVLMMEVGALMVGKIENLHEEAHVKRGQEKGNFAFGGSTVVLMTQKGTVMPDLDILRNSKDGVETRVLMGEQVGKKICRAD